jgi:hypothetical protein
MVHMEEEERDHCSKRRSESDDDDYELWIVGLIPEQKANDHVGSRGVNCCWMPHVCALRQCKLVGDADNAHMSAHRVDPVVFD